MVEVANLGLQHLSDRVVQTNLEDLLYASEVKGIDVWQGRS